MSVEALMPDAVAASELRERLDELLARATEDKHRVVLTRDGKPLAALVPIEDVEWLEELEDEEDARLAEEALREWEADGRQTVPIEDIKRELGLG